MQNLFSWFKRWIAPKITMEEYLTSRTERNNAIHAAFKAQDEQLKNLERRIGSLERLVRGR